MIIERNVGKYAILSEESVLTALNKISANKLGFVVAISEHGELQGILTDGDIRRWLSSVSEVNLRDPVSTALNTELTSLPETTSAEEVNALFSDRIRAVPLTDARGRLSGIALPGSSEMVIGRYQIGPDHPSFLIAEIGNNHNGDVEVGKRLVELAAEAGADCAKFQMRDVSSLYGAAANEEADAQDLGAQYTLDLLNKFNLSVPDLFVLFDRCRELGMEPMCTPWDLKSLEALEQYGMAAYKVASADLTNHELLTAMAQTGKPLICSTGMSREFEIQEAASLIRKFGSPFALLHCNSTYPAPFKDINLGYMKRLAALGGCPVGYSGHERGWAVPIAAVALGATVIEKHFTVDRSMEGNDHRVSLLPNEFSDMVQSIRRVEEALRGNSEKRELTQGEMMNREVLAKSLYATVNIEPGQKITEDMVSVKSPGQGLQPNRRKELIGHLSPRTIKAGTPFFPADLDESRVSPRPFKLSRPWGVPVRWHDWRAMLEVSNMDLLEYHLSYQDMESDLSNWFDEPLDIGLVVHAPELFKGDHILDLASPDPAYRCHSVAELQRVIDLTRDLKKWHKRTEQPVIITNVGGFNAEGFLAKSDREELYAWVAESWAELDCEGVELIPQTMPPFPWHFGGQSYHNLFMDPEEIAAFCQEYDRRVCFDVSHSQLACNHFRWSMSEFVELVGPYTAHLHMVDARGVDGEGLQIGDGDMDFAALCAGLDKTCPNASFVPEIWQGHKDSGAGFWFAMDALETWFDKDRRSLKGR